ncbi:MAG: GYD domain-containing protein [Sphaerobacter sp.]|nr:GYD domain-containing protein [Sphaerobacter sp.]
MPTYICLIRYTEQGIRNVKGTVERARQIEQLSQRMGGKTTAYWALGAYDAVLVGELPDDETATAFALAVSSQGNVRTETLRAFTADEMERLLQKMP